MKAVCEKCGTVHDISDEFTRNRDEVILVCRKCRYHIHVNTVMCNTVDRKDNNEEPGIFDETGNGRITQPDNNGKAYSYPGPGRIWPLVINPYVLLIALTASLIIALSIAMSDYMLKNGNTFIQRLIYLGPVLTGYTVYMFCSSIIIRFMMVLIEPLHVDIRGIGLFIIRIFTSVIIVTGLFFSSWFLLFYVIARIPNLAPVSLGFILFPLYCAGLFLGLIMLGVFFFFPVLIADRNITMLKLPGRMIRFFFSHKADMLFLIPLLVMVSLLMFTPVLFFHSSGYSLQEKKSLSDNSTNVFDNILPRYQEYRWNSDKPGISIDALPVNLPESMNVILAWSFTVISITVWMMIITVLSLVFYFRMEYAVKTASHTGNE